MALSKSILYTNLIHTMVLDTVFFVSLRKLLELTFTFGFAIIFNTVFFVTLRKSLELTFVCGFAKSSSEDSITNYSN